MSLDQTLDSMEEGRFRNKHASLLKELAKKSAFSPRELDEIALIYYKLLRETDSPSGHISRYQFRTIFHICFDMPEDTMIDRVFVALDKGIVPYVTLETWIQTFELYLRGTLEQKIDYCFLCYDYMGEGLIRRDFMVLFLRKAIIKEHEEDIEEAVKDLVDILIRKMDLDHDGAISLSDFKESVKKTPELLECLGPVIPSRESIYSFLTTFTDKIRKF